METNIVIFFNTMMQKKLIGLILRKNNISKFFINFVLIVLYLFYLFSFLL